MEYTHEQGKCVAVDRVQRFEFAHAHLGEEYNSEFVMHVNACKLMSVNGIQRHIMVMWPEASQTRDLHGACTYEIQSFCMPARSHIS